MRELRQPDLSPLQWLSVSQQAGGGEWDTPKRQSSLSEVTPSWSKWLLSETGDFSSHIVILYVCKVESHGGMESFPILRQSWQTATNVLTVL